MRDNGEFSGRIIDVLVDLYCPFVTVIIMNPADEWMMRTEDFTEMTWFLMDDYVQRGEMFVPQEKEIKRAAIQRCLMNPGIVRKGEKERQ